MRVGLDPFNALGATPAMRVQLAQSVGEHLFFAGEATSRKFPGTVHGAYLSGIKAAEAVLKAPALAGYSCRLI